MPKFRKKPVEIEAWQWGVQSDASMPDWLRSVISNDLLIPPRPGEVSRYRDQLHIGTREGVMTAQPSDWIIRGVKGELYPCKPDIFAETYESAE